MILFGEVRENPNPKFPYVAVVSNESGKVLASLPALSRILGEMYIFEVFDALEKKIAAREKSDQRTSFIARVH